MRNGDLPGLGNRRLVDEGDGMPGPNLCHVHEPDEVAKWREASATSAIIEQLYQPRVSPPRRWNHPVPHDDGRWEVDDIDDQHVTNIIGGQLTWSQIPCPADRRCPQCVAAVDELHARGVLDVDGSVPVGAACPLCNVTVESRPVLAVSVLVPGPAGSHAAWATATVFSNSMLTLNIARVSPGHRGSRLAARLRRFSTENPAEGKMVYIDTRDAAGAEIKQYQRAARVSSWTQNVSGMVYDTGTGVDVLTYCIDYGPSGDAYKPGLPDAVFALTEAFPDDGDSRPGPVIRGDDVDKRHFMDELGEYRAGRRGLIDPETGDRCDGLVLAAGVAVHSLRYRDPVQIVTPPIGTSIYGGSLDSW